jgi:hypothetical protein
VTESAEGTVVEWLEKVSDEQYAAITAPELRRLLGLGSK